VIGVAACLHDIAEAFVAELIVNLTNEGKRVTVEEAQQLNARVEGALRQAIEDECAAIRKELLS
jgi:hypothetical protein